jgi:hypothetical protein
MLPMVGIPVGLLFPKESFIVSVTKMELPEITEALEALTKDSTVE